METLPIARWSERLVAYIIDFVIIAAIILAVQAAAFSGTDYYERMYGFSVEYVDADFTTMNLVGVPPYGPLASVADDSVELAVAVFVADLTTGIMMFDYLACLECQPEAIAMNVLPYVITMAYFVGMERAFMTTVGRRAMRLRVTGTDGKRPSVKSLLIGNFGKTFLPVIDVALGLVFAGGTRQRMFSKWAGIIVVKVPATQQETKFELD